MHGRIHLGLGLRIPFLYLLQILTYLPHRVFHVLIVAVKSIVFSSKRPDVWFHQMESQFHLAKITSPKTKYHHILSALPENVMYDLPLECNEDYETLKKQ